MVFGCFRFRMKIYKEKIFINWFNPEPYEDMTTIEYDVIELNKDEKLLEPLSVFASKHKYTLFRRLNENGLVAKVIYFKNGLIHNEYNFAIINFSNFLNNVFNPVTYKRFLNGKLFIDEEKYINEIRRLRLNEIFN